jgi:DNA excision repair protein ERCC-2
MSWIREREKAKPNPEQRKLCPFFEGFEDGGGRDAVMSGVLSLGDLREFGLQKSWCPYFLGRRLVDMAQIVVFSYQYILDPRIADIISKGFPGDSIVVFDEAHNIGTSFFYSRLPVFLYYISSSLKLSSASLCLCFFLLIESLR